MLPLLLTSLTSIFTCQLCLSTKSKRPFALCIYLSSLDTYSIRQSYTKILLPLTQKHTLMFSLFSLLSTKKSKHIHYHDLHTFLVSIKIKHNSSLHAEVFTTRQANVTHFRLVSIWPVSYKQTVNATKLSRGGAFGAVSIQFKICTSH